MQHLNPRSTSRSVRALQPLRFRNNERTISLASSFLSFFFFFFFCVFLAVFVSRLGEKKVLFLVQKFFFSLTFPRKRQQKGKSFQSDFSQNNKNKQQTLNAQISSHRLIFTVLLLLEYRLIALWICYLSERTLLRVRGWFDEKFCRARKRRTETRYSQRRKNLNWWGRCVGDEWGWWWFWFSSKRRSFSRT